MKITKSTVEKIRITEVKNCDPIEVYFEDLGPRQGQVVIRCWGNAWSSYWGGIGENGIKQFFLSCDKYYLTKNFMSAGKMTEPDVEATIKMVKRIILQSRRNGEVSAKDVRNFWDERVVSWCENLEDCGTIDQIGHWINDNYESCGGVHIFDDWYFRIVQKPTSDCLWLRDRIIPAIQEALKINFSLAKQMEIR